MKKMPVIMDVDTGVDDAMAIILAWSQRDKLDLLGITTVAGNLPLTRTTCNTLTVAELCGAVDVPVAAGADKPLFIPLHTAEEVHGAVGLGNVVFPEPKKRAEKEHAVAFLRRRIGESPRPVTLIPVGPLTNIALLLLSCPEVKKNIGRIVMMGGAAFRGNESAVAEFNIFVDPEAARIVFESGIPIVMCGLDVTMQALVFPEEIEAIRNSGSAAGRFCADMLTYYLQAALRYKDSRGGCAVHDAAAVCCALYPDMFTGKRGRITVDLNGAHTRGCTVTDLRDSLPDEQKNATVALGIDRERFVKLLIESVRGRAS
ncbi:MAG: nucleoside hydrolase [Treponema sp.]|jgi:inosine-uridine nucleoside N-ribohydrolase|nr:nucleoside hydrolase [Treponema sp.]